MAQDVAPTVKNEITVIRDQLEKMGSQFEAALPAHIPVERFERVVMTAIQNNADLLKCSRQSLFNACVRAAQDGLLPDGREGAIVAYGGADAQWMPMVFGIRKKVRNSGELRDWYAEVVHEGDEFLYRKGMEPTLEHVPARPSVRGDIIAAYSVAVFKDGSRSAPEVMWIEEIEAIRIQSSKAKKGPWSVPAFYPEMCKKTVVRRHSKSLPMSSDLDDLIRRDDDLYEMENAAEEARPRKRRLGDQLDQIASQPDRQTGNGHAAEATKAEAGDGQQQRPETEDPAPRDNGQQQGESQGGAKAGGETATKAETEGKAEPAAAKTTKAATTKNAAKDKELATPKEPTNEREWKVYAMAWIDKALTDSNEEELNFRWNTKDEKDGRNRCNVSPDVREEVFDHLSTARTEFAQGAAK